MKKYSIYVQKKDGKIVQLIGTREELGLTARQIKRGSGFINLDGLKLKWSFTNQFKEPGRDKAIEIARESEEYLDETKVTFEDVKGKSIRVPWKYVGITRKLAILSLDFEILPHFIEEMRGKSFYEPGYDREIGDWCLYDGVQYTVSREYYPHPNYGRDTTAVMEATNSIAEASWPKICEFITQFKNKVAPGIYNLFVLWAKRHSYRVFDMEIKGKNGTFPCIPGLMARLDLTLNPKFFKYDIDTTIYTPDTMAYLKATQRVLEEYDLQYLLDNAPKIVVKGSTEHIQMLTESVENLLDAEETGWRESIGSGKGREVEISYELLDYLAEKK